MRIPKVCHVLLLAAPALLFATATMAEDQAPAKPTQAQAADDSPVVCKRVAVTGSRVKKEKVCKTQRQWDAYSQRAKEFMRGIERRGTTQPGGEGLSSGG
jgi:hypothetical protein